MQTIPLYSDGRDTVMEYYPAAVRTTDASVVIFPGGGYAHRAPHEGEGYALFLNALGMDAFVVEYGVSPAHRFPDPLLDARRGVRTVRAHSAEWGLDPQKVAVMGSSAGGHLAALVSNYRAVPVGETEDALSVYSPMPNATILCYPVIALSDLAVTHVGSTCNLLGADIGAAASLDPLYLVGKDTPPAFIWHTSDDGGVNVINSLRYGEVLRKNGVPFEMHIFPEGPHGLGLAEHYPHVAQWSGLLAAWFREIGFLPREAE